MAIKNQILEIRRLIDAFGGEASKFHDLSLSLFFITQQGVLNNREIRRPNHALMLWQFYGGAGTGTQLKSFEDNLANSDLNWGLRGAELSCFGMLEGEACSLFVKMAQRAGSLFDEQEARAIGSRVLEEVIESHPKTAQGKPTGVTNNNPLAVWLNYLLYHLSLTNPGRERAHKIEPDPFVLSLLALERLASDLALGKIDRSTRKLSDIQFEVAFSFPGEHRAYVAEVVSALRPSLDADSMFYDFDYQAQLAQPNLDTLLLDIYRNRSKLIVVFLCAEYAQKQWCGLEWRAVRDIIKAKEDDRIMFIRFDDAPIEGLLSIDGYVDARLHRPAALSKMILERIQQ